MRPSAITVYIATLATAASVALWATDWATLGVLNVEGVVGFVALLAMALLSESLAIRLNVAQTGNSSVTFIPLLASVQLFGPAAAVLMIVITGFFAEFIVRSKTIDRRIFNISQWTLATFVGGWAFALTGGIALQPHLEAAARGMLASQLWPFMTFGLVLLAFNHAAVSLAIALSQGLRFREVWAQMLGNSGSLQDILVSPIAIVVAFLYVQWGVWGIIVVLLPLLFIRRAYLTSSELRAANTALLQALVKAIETRDPYTSGHSLRVSRLAKLIAQQMNLSRKAVDDIETAALLHDIGKIEAVYTGILSKPDSLSSEERAIIQSHVTQGEELLRNLSSFSEEVVRTVRHHHEREDGLGYPDGLRGTAIPVGARIVAVCDAVDAMLSDRPYRDALKLDAVLEQLRVHSGKQFSAAVVDALVSSMLLEEYAAQMEAERVQKLPLLYDHARGVIPISDRSRRPHSWRRGLDTPAASGPP